MSEEADSQFIRRYDALPMEERGAFRRAYGDARGFRVRIRDLGPMRSAAYDQPTGAPTPAKRAVSLDLRPVRRRSRSTTGPRTPRRSGRPDTYTERGSFTVRNADGEPIFDVTIDIVIRKR
ncbi:hypothetical protein OG625_05170 [Streptomyces sp. NBC_01351]|uniref:hypothetical protein n=1 Tax=Streptomyces sp. NBC_01351 TaxID=2903833 RepID=UPI002E2FCDE7|nr:hypothetical protein [Streptomyces sp. NBC_01351]